MKKIIAVLIASILLTACITDNVLTTKEMEIQSKADVAVSEILFNSGLDTRASYHVRKDGHVEIKFVPSVSMIDYTLVVEKLRSNQSIRSVHASQSGSEVCPLN